MKTIPVKLNHILSFGKHSGMTVQQIIETDPGYIRWAKQNLRWFYLDEEAFQYYVSVLRKIKTARTPDRTVQSHRPSARWY